jgi:hypothetical protein
VLSFFPGEFTYNIVHTLSLVFDLTCSFLTPPPLALINTDAAARLEFEEGGLWNRKKNKELN